MNPGKSASLAIAIALTASTAPAAEAVWPKDSASELSIFVTSLRFRIYADHCSEKLPQSRPGFDALMERLNSRIQVISKSLLASAVFRDMKDKPVPAVIIDAFKDSFGDAKHNFERQDAASACPKTLQNLGEMDDESLKAGLTEVLTSVQNMIQKLEEQRARQQPPFPPT
jgi:hypothetical protein